jgi:hypothetical protein
LMLRMTRCGFSSVRIALRGSGSEERYFLRYFSRRETFGGDERLSGGRSRAVSLFAPPNQTPNAKRQTRRVAFRARARARSLDARSR